MEDIPLEGDFKNSDIKESPLITEISGRLPQLYANAFAVGFSFSDVYLIGQLNGSPSFVLNMSYTTAKSLQETLAKVIDKFQKASGVDIHTMSQIQNALNEK